MTNTVRVVYDESKGEQAVLEALTKIRNEMILRLAGDGPAGRLLYQVLYWRTRMRIMRDGLLWIVKTRAQWMAETALSRHQYDRALARLKERHLVETCYRRFRGVKTTHLRPVTYIAMMDFEEFVRMASEYLESAEADGGARTRSGRADA